MVDNVEPVEPWYLAQVVLDNGPAVQVESHPRKTGNAGCLNVVTLTKGDAGLTPTPLIADTAKVYVVSPSNDKTIVVDNVD